MAEDALKEDLMTRRVRHCLAARLKGQWGPVWPDWMEQQRWNANNREKELANNHRLPVRLDSSKSESDTSMEEETDQEERGKEEVQMKDLLGNEEEDVEAAASQLMPADVVQELALGERDAK